MFKLSRNRRASGFAQIPNAALRDKGLSARARGVLCHMLSHSDGFEITRKMLGEQFPEGRDAIETALRELREAGYLRTVRVQGEGGRFLGAQYLVFDERGAADEVDDEGEENHGPGNPHTGARETTARETRSPGNPHPYKNTIPIEHQHQEHQENTTRKRGRESVISAAFDELWKVYPRKVGKRTAQQAFERAVMRGAGKSPTIEQVQAEVDLIVAGARSFAAGTREAGTETRFVPHASTWLNGDRWTDETAPVSGREMTAAERMAQSLQQGSENPWISGGAISAGR